MMRLANLMLIPFVIVMEMVAMHRPALSAVIVIDASAVNITGPIWLDGKSAIGVPGDYIPIANGVHRITLGPTHGYDLALQLVIQGNRVTVKADTPEKQCPPGPRASSDPQWNIVSWEAPIVTLDQNRSQSTRIVLKSPKFQSTTVQCMTMPLSISCTQVHGILILESDPVGAEIWIDGKNTNNKTNSRLSVPFCQSGSGEASVLLRMPSRLNCVNQVVLRPNSEQKIACQMTTP
jgi:hypothetical protein